jgi:8-oxo-dGTP diphosphatase
VSLAGQRVDPGRYAVIPRTLSFLIRKQDILLIRRMQPDHPWSGLLNGVGGHIEVGEDPKQGALREILEETGLSPTRLELVGVVLINIQKSPGIGLYVFVGEVPAKDPPQPSPEGVAEWHPMEALEELPLVEDLPYLIPRAMASYQGAPAFCALYSYDEHGALRIGDAPA